MCYCRLLYTKIFICLLPTIQLSLLCLKFLSNFSTRYTDIQYSVQFDTSWPHVSRSWSYLSFRAVISKTFQCRILSTYTYLGPSYHSASIEMRKAYILTSGLEDDYRFMSKFDKIVTILIYFLHLKKNSVPPLMTCIFSESSYFSA